MYKLRSIVLRLCVWVSLLVVCRAQSTEQLLEQNPCTRKTTCSDCIRMPSCAWCFDSDFNGTRCLNLAIDGTAGCDEAYILVPDNERSVDPMYNMDLSRTKSRMAGSSSFAESINAIGSSFAASGSTSFYAPGAGPSETLVQIKPQKIKLSLRMNEMQRLSFQYSRAQDFPVDLYYFMDLSRSMKTDKKKLIALGSLLSASLRNMTSDFRIGFGVFSSNSSYQNLMPLSKDAEFFDKAIANATVSDNLGASVGGLEAIMQAVVCKQQIEWRDQARRILVFSTDSDFHYAGDGEVGGIVHPKDTECQMQNNIYTHSTLQDYPSVLQINHEVKKHKINVIFTVPAGQISSYEQLSGHIEGSSTGVLSNDSTIIDLVREQYNSITSTVEMKDSSSDAVHIVYYSSCLDDKELIQTNKCEGLKVGDIVEYTADITLKECPKNPKKWKETFKISPVGTSDSLIIELEMICGCPCEEPGHYAFNASPQVCNGAGVLACGVCACFPGRFGKNCECLIHDGMLPDQELGCRPTNASSDPLCSNRGTCICGTCACNAMEDPLQVVSGAFCECDNFSCPMHNGVLCSGPDQGECVCGKCSCRTGYTGPACQSQGPDALPFAG